MIKKWLNRIDQVLERLLICAARRQCVKHGHKWVDSGTLNPRPLIWRECERLGCSAQTGPILATAEWHGRRSFTLSPLIPVSIWDGR